MDDCICKVCNKVDTVDLFKRYWQLPLTPCAAEVSDFVTPDLFGQYSMMAFGMRNTPSIFQILMHLVLRDIKNCKTYIDDIVVYSSKWEHDENLCEVF